ncbi:MAG: hypothetical protein GY811_02160 [Myxococcales bacterium]|nr:hypothetical protein [Myxococcales bacterium]
MKSKTLAEIVSKYGQGTKEGEKIVIPEEKSLTLYASLGGEALMIADVRSFEVSDEMVFASTGKGDFFAIATEDVRAIRIGPQAGKKRTGLIRG